MVVFGIFCHINLSTDFKKHFDVLMLCWFIQMSAENNWRHDCLIPGRNSSDPA